MIRIRARLCRRAVCVGWVCGAHHAFGQEPPASQAGDSDEIVVQGLPPDRPIVEHRLRQREILTTPGTLGDALRAVQSLPGVARTPALSGLIVVRGTPAESTQVFFQDSPAPQIYHFGGLSSVVPTEMLESIRFQPGNFEARFGRGIGGIVDARIRRARNDGRYHLKGQLDFVDARVLAEGPLAIDDAWRFLGGVRRSHMDAWMGPLLKASNSRFERLPVYYDYQLFLERDLPRNSYVRVGVYGSDDRIDLTSSSQIFLSTLRQDVSFVNGISEVSLNLDADTAWHQTFSVGRSFEQKQTGATETTNETFSFAFRGKLVQRLSRSIVLRLGPDVLYAPHRFFSRAPGEAAPREPFAPPAIGQPPKIVESRSASFQPAVFGEVALAPWEGLEASLGLRLDYTWETRRYDISPRLALSYDLRREFPMTKLKMSAGLHHEPPEGRYTAERPELRLRATRSSQVSLGIEQEITGLADAQIEAFAAKLDWLTSHGTDARGLANYGNSAEGKIGGIELLLRYRADAHFFGWLSYTLSRSTRRWSESAPSELFGNDQTHVLSVLGSYRWTSGWQIGTRFRAASGVPRAICEQTLLRNADAAEICLGQSDKIERAPWFHQLDLRVEKEWRFEKSGRIASYLDLINVYNREQADLPFIPALGIRGEL